MSTQRTLVLVAGSGRSGTSLVTGILQRLGFHVPQPEVPADATNPRGFAESQWVVDFHTRLLRAARVQVSDARPSAWADAARIALEGDAADQLRSFLAATFAQADDVIVKDPRLSWFLPLWQRCAQDAGASSRFVTMLRHPASVIDSKQRWYGGWQGEVARASGWMNQTLFTERATRGSRRAFVGYEDLLGDWTQAVARVGETLELEVVRAAQAPAMREVHAFVDRSLSRSRSEWGDAPVPPSLRVQADHVWELMSRLAADPVPGAHLAAALDAARTDYVTLYADAEAIVGSSIAAAEKAAASGAQRLPAPARWLRRRLPARLRAAIPTRIRRGVVRRLVRSTGAAVA